VSSINMQVYVLGPTETRKLSIPGPQLASASLNALSPETQGQGAFAGIGSLAVLSLPPLISHVPALGLSLLVPWNRSVHHPGLFCCISASHCSCQS
jgi:hypothetical protein